MLRSLLSDRKSIFFIKQGRISAIAGLEGLASRSISDLNAGLENFIFNYGNEAFRYLRDKREDSTFILDRDPRRG
jgi:hypothetical protein